MKDFKDIGSLFEDRLRDAQVTADPTLWNRIDATMKRRKRIIWLWSTGVIIIVGAGLLWWNSNDKIFHTDKSAVTNSIASEETRTFRNNTTSEPYLTPRALAIAKIFENSEGMTTRNNSDITISKENKRLENSEENKSEKPDNNTAISDIHEGTFKKQENIKKEVPTKREKNDMEGFKKKTIYHYYNSATDSFYSTTNKRELDSITKANTPGTITIKDSLEQ